MPARSRTRGGVIAAALAAALVCAPVAQADHHDSDLPWPSLLPPQEGVPTDVQPGPVTHCRKPTIRCVDSLSRRLHRQWLPLHRKCDHRAVAAYSYLAITNGLAEDLRRRNPRFFRHKRWMFTLIAAFSNRYFRAYRDYEAGRPLPDAWQITFDQAARGDINAGQDVLLFSNAHVQHDLPLVMAELGLRERDGDWHKHDHDAVNQINTRVYDGIQDYIAGHYDESFGTIDMQPSPLEEMGSLEFVKSWREGAWRNAERLLTAGTPEERARVEEDIRTTSRLWAERIASFQNPGWRAQRDAYCRSRVQAAR